MSKYNLGIVKASLLSNLNEQVALKEFVKILKESSVLNLTHTIFDNLEKKHISNEDLAIKYIDENLNLIKKQCSREVFEKETQKILPLIEGIAFSDTNKGKLYENIHTMITESLNGKKATNVNKLHDSFSFVLEHLTTSPKKAAVEEVELPKELVINEFILKRAINEFNSKYAGVLSEEEMALIKSIVHENAAEKKKSFETIKESTLHSLKALKEELENQDEKAPAHEQREAELFATKINESITNIEKLKFGEETFTKDVLDLVNLKKELE